MSHIYADLLAEIRHINGVEDAFLPLHAPVFMGNEKDYLCETIDSTFVSSVGAYVDRFEAMLQEYTDAKRAVVCANGTAALEMSLIVAGVKAGDLVLTQAISFIATANAIAHIGAEPIFVDIERETLGMNPDAMQTFLEKECHMIGGFCYHKASARRISACVPMHTFGIPCRIEDLATLCASWNIALVEDAAEAMGSLRHGKHCGTFGKLGALSFNGNKIMTTGGGGAILTNDEDLGALAKHLTTTAKIPHKWLYEHDHIGWNFRMPNLNAALGCAQLEQLPYFLEQKRKLAVQYAEYFAQTEWEFIAEPQGAQSNYWLCAVLMKNHAERDAFLETSNNAGVMTRPVWGPLHTQNMYRSCLRGDLSVTMDIADRLVNLPSGVQQGNGTAK